MEVTLSLSVKRNADGSALIRYGIPLWYRIIALVIFALLATAVVLARGTSVIGLIILAISALAAAYEETWQIDGGKRQVRARTGLVILARKTNLSFDDVESMEIVHFARGKVDQANLPEPNKMPPGSQARLVLTTKNGDHYLINAVPFRRRAGLERDALEISRVIGVGVALA